jgi:tetratricopeptide (TPR) repeat protein
MADTKTKEVAEQTVTAVSSVDKYKNVVLILVGVVALAAGGYFFYQYQLTESNKEAQNEIYPAVYFFEQDSLDKALKGDGKVLGLLDIADKYAGTKTGKLAHFYAGVAYMKQAKFEDAITHLNEFSADDHLVQARAYALIGDANMELQKYDEAVSFYNKAASYKANEQFTPSYLMKLALAYELLKDNAKAIETYDIIITKYPKSTDLIDAKKYKARLGSLATE